jgi:hypothetical protein
MTGILGIYAGSGNDGQRPSEQDNTRHPEQGSDNSGHLAPVESPDSSPDDLGQVSTCDPAFYPELVV